MGNQDKGTYISHTLEPAVVSPETNEQIATIIVQGGGKVCSTSANVELLMSQEVNWITSEERIVTNRIPAITAGCSATFILSDLHEALFASTTNGIGIAGTLLHGKGRQHDSR